MPLYLETTALESGRLMFNTSGLKGKDIYLYIWNFKFQIDGIVKNSEQSISNHNPSNVTKVP
jgi:hypothetical protein